MAEYINKAKLKQAVRDKWQDLETRVEVNCIVNEMPTIDIVHCSECIHRLEFKEYNRTHDSFDLCVECKIDGKYHDDSWFCANGERRTE